MFNNLNEIIEEFDLSSSTKNDIRKELKIKLKDCHPGVNKDGEFLSDEKKLLFERISSAIEFIDAPVELVLSKEISDLKKVVQDLAIRKNEDEISLKKEEVLTKKIDSNIKNYATIHLFPKITSSIIAGLLSIIWLFPKTVSEHMILKKYIDVESPRFSLIWLLGLFFTGYLWLILNMLERRDKERKNSLKLESVQNMLFDEFISYKGNLGMDEEKEIQFSKEEFIQFIRGFNLRRKEFRPERRDIFSPYRVIFGDSKIDMGLAQDLSEIVLSRMQSKELVKVITQKTISDIYIVELNSIMRNYYRQQKI